MLTNTPAPLDFTPSRAGVAAVGSRRGHRAAAPGHSARSLGSDRRASITSLLIGHWQFEASFCTPGEGHEKGGAMTAVALTTSVLRVGCMVFDNDFRHPAVLAKEAATIDVLTGGRFEFGIGAGWHKPEYEQAGISFERL